MIKNIKNIKRIFFIMIIFLVIVNISNISVAKTLNGRTLDELNTKIKRELIDNGCPEAKANVRISEAKGATVEWDNTSQNKHYKAKISNSVGSAAAAMGYQATITIEQTEIKSEGTTSGGSTSGGTSSGGSTSGGSTSGGSTSGGTSSGGSTSGGSTSGGTSSGGSTSGGSTSGGTSSGGSTSGGSTSGGASSGGSSSGGSTSGGTSSGGSTSGGSTSGGTSSGGSSSGGASENKEITTDSGQIIGNSLADLNTKIKNRLINNGCPEDKARVNITLAKGATVEWDNTSQKKHYKATISNAMSSPTGAGNYQATVTIKTTEITSENTTSGGTSSGTDSTRPDSTRPDRAPIQTPSREEDGKTEYTPGEIVDGAQGFIQTGENNGGNDKIKQDNMINLSNTIYNILLVIGIVIALIVGLILGIKFVLGSLEDKAEIKTMLIPYIVGCLVVFGAFVIWKIVVDLLQTI